MREIRTSSPFCFCVNAYAMWGMSRKKLGGSMKKLGVSRQASAFPGKQEDWSR
jgi:hypothetical protein